MGESGAPGEETSAGTEGRGDGVDRGVAVGVEGGVVGVLATGNEDVVGVGEAVRFKTMADTAVTGGVGGVGVGVGVGEGVGDPSLDVGSAIPVFDVTCTRSWGD